MVSAMPVLGQPVTEPAFRRIVQEYRRAIAAGELRPGDRLPSTRALAAQWGVAPATAARALTELTRAGAVLTQSRTGSVVAPARRGPAGSRPPLQRSTMPAALVLDLEIVLFAHGQGLAANLEREQRVTGDTGVSSLDWEAQQIPVLRGLGDRPGLGHFGRLMDRLSTGYDFDLDALFEIGLQALLDGFAVIVQRAGRTA